MTPEFSRPLRVHEIGTVPRHSVLTATLVERAAIAQRFDLVDLAALTADFSARAEAGGVRVTGRIRAAGSQPCGLSGEPVAFDLDEAVDLRFAAVVAVGDEEIELSDADLDTLPIDGDTIDLGEAAAQSLGLALDPYPRAPGAELPAAVIPEDQVVPIRRDNPFSVLRK